MKRLLAVAGSAALAAAVAPVDVLAQVLPDIRMSERIVPNAAPNLVQFEIQQAFAEAVPGQRVVLDGAGRTYVIDNELIPSSGDHLHIEAGVTLQADPASDVFTRALGNRSVITLTPAVDGFSVTGDGKTSVINGVGRAARGAVTGADLTGLGTTYQEDRHGVAIYGARNVTVDDLTISNQGGDGVLVLGGGPPGTVPAPARDVRITHLRSVANRRQGISVTNVDGLVIADSVLERTGRTRSPGSGSPATNPSAGLDLEPDRASDVLRNVVVRDTVIRDNLGDGLTFFLGPLDDASAPVDARVTNLWIDGNGQNGITFSQIGNGSPDERVNGRIVIEDTVVSNTRGVMNDCCRADEGVRGTAGVFILQNPGASPADPYATDPDDLRITLNGVTVRGTAAGGVTVAPIALRSYGAAPGTNESRPESTGRVDFWNVAVIDGADRPVMRAALNDTSTFVSNLTGEIHGFNPNGVRVDYDLDRRPDPTATVAVRDATAFAGGNVLADGQWVATGGARADGGVLTLSPGARLTQALPSLVGGDVSRNYVFAADVSVDDGSASFEIGLEQRLPGGERYGRLLSARGGGKLAKGVRVPSAAEAGIASARFVIENTGRARIRVRGLTLAPAEGPVLGVP